MSSSAVMPRPILKRSPHSTTLATPIQGDDAPFLRISTPTPRCANSVRFPPSPTLTRTFSAHSPSSYDRSPIVVLPNTCALPARGCPGRTYLPGDSPCSAYLSAAQDIKRAAMKNKGRSMHPRAAAHAASAAQSSYSEPPALVPDLSSESDESDGSTSPPTEALSPSHIVPLAFLPHPPSSSPKQKAGIALMLNTALYHAPEPEEEEQYQYHTYEEEKRRRRERGKGDWEQRALQHARERDMGARDLERQTADLTLGEEELDEEDEADDDDLAGSTGGRYKSFFGGSLRGCGLDEEDGCLGGF